MTIDYDTCFLCPVLKLKWTAFIDLFGRASLETEWVRNGLEGSERKLQEREREREEAIPCTIVKHPRLSDLTDDFAFLYKYIHAQRM